jgi:hypothetical protein
MNTFSPDISGKLVETPDYFNRIDDNYDRFGPGVTMMWRNIYAGRNVEVLKSSFPTMIPALVGLEVRSIYAKAIDHPVHKGVDVDINIWPYKLDDIEQDEICLALQSMIIPVDEYDEYAFDTRFRTISVAPKDFTLELIRENYAMVIMYDFQEWYDIQAAEIIKGESTARLTTMCVPMLFKHTPKRKDLIAQDGQIQNPFDDTKRILSLYIQLDFWDARVFSLPSPFEA